MDRGVCGGGGGRDPPGECHGGLTVIVLTLLSSTWAKAHRSSARLPLYSGACLFFDLMLVLLSLVNSALSLSVELEACLLSFCR